MNCERCNHTGKIEVDPLNAEEAKQPKYEVCLCCFEEEADISEAREE